MAIASKLLNLILPTKASKKPVGSTNTFNPTLGDRSFLPAPAYQDHLTDLQTLRQSSDAKSLMSWLFKQDPDVSAAVNAYLTTADTPLIVYVQKLDGSFDEQGHKTVSQILLGLTTRTDYSKGYQRVTSLRGICEQLRYMILLRGAVGVELVLDKYLIPNRLNNIDMVTIKWQEKEAGVYTPVQTAPASGRDIDLNIPTFFTAFFRQDPTSIYPESNFVSAINTIAARQQVINDLYRIMQITGYPRMDLSVLEETLIKNAPASVQQNAEERRKWVNARLQEISQTLSSLRPDQPLVHTDSTEVKIINDRNPGLGVDISHVINVLNGQNQAALKTMATIIGRGESGVNTASVEARVFSMNADQLNRPVSDVLSQALTFALRLTGSESYVTVGFDEAELRSATEMEPQLTLKQTRLLGLLSMGVISDMEFTMAMLNRPPLPGAPKLSGTNFMPVGSAQTNADTAANTSGNTDSVGRSLGGQEATKAGKATRSNTQN